MSLESIFYPKSVCLIGSSRLKKQGMLVSPEIFHRTANNLRRFFEGKVAVIDVEYSKIFPEADLYVLCLPEEKTLENVENFNCKACIILPGDYHKKGLLLQKLKEKKVRLLGPNSVCGVVNTDNGLNTTFEDGLMPKRGHSSFVCQSGGVGASIFDYSISNFAGVAKIVWLGNAWNIDFPELIEYLSKDKQTKSMGIYVEGLKDGKKFMETVKKTRKPIVALKGGFSEAGSERAFSHTASLSGSGKIFSSVFKQLGIVEVNSLKELYEATVQLSKWKPKGDRIAIVSNVGGPSILAADYAHKFGFQLPPFTKKTVDRIKKEYPEISVINPLDLIADADGKRYEFCLKEVSKDPNIDVVIVINMLKSCTLSLSDVKKIAQVIRNTKKPTVDCVPAFDDWQRIREVMGQEDVYVFEDTERAMKILSAMKTKIKKGEQI